MGYVLTKSGFFVFSQCPRGLSSQAFANTIAPSAASVSLNRIPLTPATSRTSASRRATIGLVDRPPAGPGWLHALALLVGQEAVMLRAARGLAADEALIDGEAGCETTGEATSARS